MEIQRDFLEGVLIELKEQKELLDEIKGFVEDRTNDVQVLIDQIDGVLEADIRKKIKKIEPQFCTHKNKKIDVHKNAETVTCEDCGLLLSFKQL